MYQKLWDANQLLKKGKAGGAGGAAGEAIPSSSLGGLPDVSGRPPAPVADTTGGDGGQESKGMVQILGGLTRRRGR